MTPPDTSTGTPPFYIIKKGIYIHGIYGPYESRAAAFKALDKAHDEADPEECNDFDGYHNYYLVNRLGEKVGDPVPELGEFMPYGEKKP